MPVTPVTFDAPLQQELVEARDMLGRQVSRDSVAPFAH
jgi:hypothetical protein